MKADLAGTLTTAVANRPRWLAHHGRVGESTMTSDAVFFIVIALLVGFALGALSQVEAVGDDGL
jgi:hypothetical protein